MNPLDELRGMPAGSLVPVEWVRDVLLDGRLAEVQASGEALEPFSDLTPEDIARAEGRKPSTVRGWLGAGRIPGAYKIRGRSWRVPREAYRAFLESERRASQTESEAPGDLSAWRKLGRQPNSRRRR